MSDPDSITDEAVIGDPIAHARKLLDLLSARMVSGRQPGVLELPLATALRVLVVHCEQAAAQVNARWEQRIRDLTGGHRIGWTHNNDLMNLLDGGASAGRTISGSSARSAKRPMNQPVPQSPEAQRQALSPHYSPKCQCRNCRRLRAKMQLRAKGGGSS